jgi:transmembrane protein TMEM174 (potassium channel)
MIGGMEEERGQEERGPIELGSGRVEAFSDAVFAVIITIMALELRAPQGHTLGDVRGSSSPSSASRSWGSTGTTTTISCAPRIGSAAP